MTRTYSFVYPNCRKCGVPFRVVHIEPAKPGYDKRTFWCSDCNHSETILVKYE
jgi:hypothetical protein